MKKLERAVLPTTSSTSTKIHHFAKEAKKVNRIGIEKDEKVSRFIENVLIV